MLPSGELLVRRVDDEDKYRSYQCRAVNRLTGATLLSGGRAKFSVTGKSLTGRSSYWRFCVGPDLAEESLETAPSEVDESPFTTQRGNSVNYTKISPQNPNFLPFCMALNPVDVCIEEVTIGNPAHTISSLK